MGFRYEVLSEFQVIDKATGEHRAAVGGEVLHLTEVGGIGFEDPKATVPFGTPPGFLKRQPSCNFVYESQDEWLTVDALQHVDGLCEGCKPQLLIHGLPGSLVVACLVVNTHMLLFVLCLSRSPFCRTGP